MDAVGPAMPSCTAIRTSRSSTARATPRSWPRKRRGSGSPRWRSPTTTGSTASVRFAEAARELGLPTVFGAELTLGARRSPPNGDRRSARASTSSCSREGPVGYARLARAISEAQLAGEKGAPRIIARRARRRGRARRCTSTGNAERAQRLAGSCSPAAARARCRPRCVRDGPAAAERALDELVDAFGRDRVLVELWDHGDPLDRHRNDALAQLALRAGCRGGRDQQRALRHARAPAARDRARRGARPPFARRDRRLAAGRAVRAPAQRRPSRRAASRAGRARSSAPSRSRGACAFDLKLAAPRAARLPGARRAHRDDVAARARARGARPSSTRRRTRSTTQAMRQIDYELDVIEQLGFPGYFLLLHDIVEFCRRSRHLLPGAGERGEQRGLLRARRHQGRRGRARPAVRAVPLARARRPARHRPRHRAPAPRGGDPVRLRALRARPRRAGGERHHLPAPLGAAGDGEGRGPLTRSGRRARQVGRPLGRRPRSLRRADVDNGVAGPLAMVTPRRSTAAAPVRADASAIARATACRSTAAPPRRGRRRSRRSRSTLADRGARLPAPPRHPLGRHGDGRPSARRVLPDRVGAHGGPLGAPVGQGRLRGGRPREVRPARPRACSRCCTSRSTSSASTKASRSTSPPSRRKPRSTTCCARPTPSACSRSRAGRRWPRCRGCGPRSFYDLVVEVALIRPGPIQGGSVHPYLRRRNGEEEVTYIHPLTEPCLKKTLGVPLFQEQLMQLAVDCAGFSRGRGRPAAPGDGLEAVAGAHGARCATGCMDGHGRARHHRRRPPRRSYTKLEAFVDFGFPESHSVSFAYLVYSSSWIKYHYPAEFAASLLNAQPMGFYSPHTIVRDARRHGVQVLGPDLNASRRDATLEPRTADVEPIGRPLPRVPRRAVAPRGAARAAVGARPARRAARPHRRRARRAAVHRPRRLRPAHRRDRRPGRGARDRGRVRAVLRPVAPLRAVGRGRARHRAAAACGATARSSRRCPASSPAPTRRRCRA